jgi:hypothetical protein
MAAGASLIVGIMDGDPARVYISQRCMLYFLPLQSGLEPTQNPSHESTTTPTP